MPLKQHVGEIVIGVIIVVVGWLVTDRMDSLELEIRRDLDELKAGVSSISQNQTGMLQRLASLETGLGNIKEELRIDIREVRDDVRTLQALVSGQSGTGGPIEKEQ